MSALLWLTFFRNVRYLERPLIDFHWLNISAIWRCPILKVTLIIDSSSQNWLFVKLPGINVFDVLNTIMNAYKTIKRLTTCLTPSGKTTFIGYIISFGFALTFLRNAMCDWAFRWLMSSLFPCWLVLRTRDGARSIGNDIFLRTRGEAIFIPLRYYKL